MRARSEADNLLDEDQVSRLRVLPSDNTWQVGPSDREIAASYTRQKQISKLVNSIDSKKINKKCAQRTKEKQAKNDKSKSDRQAQQAAQILIFGFLSCYLCI